MASTGLRFCGIAEDTPRPPAAGSATSATSVRDIPWTSRANLPSTPVTALSAQPMSHSGIRRLCQGAAGSARPSSAANRAANSMPWPGPSAAVPRAYSW